MSINLKLVKTLNHLCTNPENIRKDVIDRVCVKAILSKSTITSLIHLKRLCIKNKLENAQYYLTVYIKKRIMQEQQLIENKKEVKRNE